ncbi:hypothetical protein OG394_39970 [Kribbella sp. NBC_01245]|uniref:hypothetical protein n=1 Tax=Kribbella sp. NBC_01245 TaxID=2903578 RepID=UPI002E2B346F|nr:hypothetical protein [Kribbella sp. NBC_01245]
MTSETGMSLIDALERWKNFEECLIHDIRPVRYGYGVDIAINSVWRDGKVRPDVLQKPDLVTLSLLGVESLRFTGGLTDDMKRDPAAINWGLTEISHIVDSSSDGSAAITVHWPGDRSLFVQYLNLEVLVAGVDPEPGERLG